MADQANMGRRALFQAIPATFLAGAVAAMPLAAATVDPIIRQYEEWVALRAFLDSKDAPASEPEFDALVNDLGDIGKQIMESQPVTPAGAAAQLECALSDDCFDGRYCDQRDEVMAKNLIAFLRTL